MRISEKIMENIGSVKLEGRVDFLFFFSSLDSDVDKVTQNQLRRGQRLCESLKQFQLTPLIVKE